MTVLFMDSFDAQDVALKWESNLGATPDFAEPSRYAIGSTFSASTSSGRVRKGFAAAAEVVVGFAFRLDNLAAARTLLTLHGDAGATAHVNIQVTTAGALSVFRGITSVATSSAGTIVAGQWYYLEVRATIADAGGIVQTRIDGALVNNFTGDTKNGGTANTIDFVTLGTATVTDPLVTYDDLYILNALGSAPVNTFLGEVVVQTLVPTGAGANTQLTPVGSANNWENVDELPYSTADYNASDTVGHKDTYAMGNLAASTGTVFAVQTNIIGNKTGPGAASFKPVVRSGGTDYVGTATPLGPSPSWIGEVREQNPATSAAWAVSGVNAVEVGAEVA